LPPGSGTGLAALTVGSGGGAVHDTIGSFPTGSDQRMLAQASLHHTVRVSGLTTDELIAQADAICARYRDREAPLRAAIPRDDSPKAYRCVGGILPELAALLREQTAELERLDVPAEFAASWRENLDRLSRSADLLDEGGAAAAAHDRDRFVAVAAEARTIELEMAAFAERVGFSVCGRA
jgi:hypothetical protein